MQRLTMGGTDPVLTDDRIADLILEYATELGRVGTTAAVMVPAVQHGRAVEARMLLGPASQITVLPDDDLGDAAVLLPGAEDVVADLRRRIDLLTGRAAPEAINGGMEAFDGLDPFGDLEP